MSPRPNALLAGRAAIEGAAEAGCLGVVLGAESAVRTRQAGIAATALQVIDADISGEARPHRELALDAAARRHRQILRKQHGANLGIAVGTAGGAHQRPVLLGGAKVLRRRGAALPETRSISRCFRLIRVITKSPLAPGDKQAQVASSTSPAPTWYEPLSRFEFP